MSRAGVQTGDPDRAAQAILALVNSPQPPVDLLPGADTLARLDAQRRRFDQDVQAWRGVTAGTGFGV